MGPTGSGKTWTALEIATAMGGKIAFIDTERQSADNYADDFDFDVIQLHSYSVQNYIDAINDASSEGYDNLIIDSLSHAWAGKDGILEFVDLETKKSKAQNSYVTWRKATPLHNQFIDNILVYPGNIIATMRSKMEYVMEENDKGKKVPKKIGLQPIQRADVEYEFQIIGDMSPEHDLVIAKSRVSVLADKVISPPKTGIQFAKFYRAWSGGEAVEKAIAEARKGAPLNMEGYQQTQKNLQVKYETARTIFTTQLGWPEAQFVELIAEFCKTMNLPNPEENPEIDYESMSKIVTYVREQYKNAEKVA